LNNCRKNFRANKEVTAAETSDAWQSHSNCGPDSCTIGNSLNSRRNEPVIPTQQRIASCEPRLETAGLYCTGEHGESFMPAVLFLLIQSKLAAPNHGAMTRFWPCGET